MVFSRDRGTVSSITKDSTQYFPTITMFSSSGLVLVLYFYSQCFSFFLLTLLLTLRVRAQRYTLSPNTPDILIPLLDLYYDFLQYFGIGYILLPLIPLTSQGNYYYIPQYSGSITMDILGIPILFPTLYHRCTSSSSSIIYTLPQVHQQF